MERRRDKKGRILRTGESQRADGRYVYKYTDGNHRAKFVYSWKLEPTDKVPAGKRDCAALRDKEKQIIRDTRDGLEPNGGKRTLLEQVKICISEKDRARYNTKMSYQYITAKLEQDPFSAGMIGNIKQSDAKQWTRKLKDKGYSYNTVRSIVKVARMAMDEAVQDGLARRNPFDFNMGDVIENDTKAKAAWTEQERDKFLEFCRTDTAASLRYDGFYILFHTGMRISELCGLTMEDVDLDRNIISINKQLINRRGAGVAVGPAKTAAGNRTLPMTDKVRACFAHILDQRRNQDSGPCIDGYSGFLFTTARGAPTTNANWGYYINHAWKRYNAAHKDMLPPITPHICRHTYCSIMAAAGMDPKVLQYLMGHSCISVTLDVYTHVTVENANAEMERLAAKALADIDGKRETIGES